MFTCFRQRISLSHSESLKVVNRLWECVIIGIVSVSIDLLPVCYQCRLTRLDPQTLISYQVRSPDIDSLPGSVTRQDSGSRHAVRPVLSRPLVLAADSNVRPPGQVRSGQDTLDASEHPSNESVKLPDLIHQRYLSSCPPSLESVYGFRRPKFNVRLRLSR